jgi:hypothetical protein
MRQPNASKATTATKVPTSQSGDAIGVSKHSKGKSDEAGESAAAPHFDRTGGIADKA